LTAHVDDVKSYTSAIPYARLYERICRVTETSVELQRDHI